MIGVEETYSNELVKVPERGKSTSKAIPITYIPTRTVEEIDEREKLEKIAEKVFDLIEGVNITVGIPEGLMIELSSKFDPIYEWICMKKKN